MHQEDLWSAAPAPVTVTQWTRYDPVTDGYSIDFDLHYSKAFAGGTVHLLHFALTFDELEVATSLGWTAHRYFWRGRKPKEVEREIRKALVKYRAEAVTTPALVNGFRAVDFG